MTTTLQDVSQRLGELLATFAGAGEDCAADHEFIANFVGFDEVLSPAYAELCQLGFEGDPPNGGGWIYMHAWRPLTRDSVLQLAEQLEDLGNRHRCLFELLDVTLILPRERGQVVFLGGSDFQGVVGNA